MDEFGGQSFREIENEIFSGEGLCGIGVHSRKHKSCDEAEEKTAKRSQKSANVFFDGDAAKKRRKEVMQITQEERREKARNTGNKGSNSKFLTMNKRKFLTFNVLNDKASNGKGKESGKGKGKTAGKGREKTKQEKVGIKVRKTSTHS
jgi:hypothetical protein